LLLLAAAFYIAVAFSNIVALVVTIAVVRSVTVTIAAPFNVGAFVALVTATVDTPIALVVAAAVAANVV
jgi:hypothetical protein